MNISNELYDLKTTKARLEYALIEERFHYESIPKRKAITKSKALLCLGFAIPLTIIVLINLALLIFAIIYTASDNDPSGVIGAIFLISPLTVLLLGIAVIKLWSIWLSEMGLLHGVTKKALNYGATNYNDEEKKSHAKIAELSQKILDIDAKIGELKSQRSYEEVQANKKESKELQKLSDDEFFAYAYGRWGDSRDDLRINMATSKYEDEADSLNQRIKTEEELLNSLAHIRSHIISEYDSAKSRFTLYLLSMLLVAFVELAVFTSSSSQIYMMSIGISYGIIGGIYTIPFLFKRYMAYMVEFNYEKVTMYAEENHLEPTEHIRIKSMAKIKDYMYRLEYLDKILEYKASHKL